MLTTMSMHTTLSIVLLAAALLPGCGGGEEPDDALTARESDAFDPGPPSRGAQWLQATPPGTVFAAP